MGKKEDIRSCYLASIIKNVYITKANAYLSDNNKEIVIRGYKKEKHEKDKNKIEYKALGDCSFSAEFKKYYYKIFEIAFCNKNENCFLYDGEKENEKTFARDQVINNSVKYFKKHDIDVDYIFYSEFEKYLFSKWIYSLFVRLLEVLFADYNCSGDQRDNIVENKIKNIFIEIKNELNRYGIIRLIYSNAKANEVDLIIDSKYDKSECNRAYLFKLGNNVESQLGAVVVSGDIRLVVENNIKKNELIYERFPFSKDKDFYNNEDEEYAFISVWNLIKKEYFFPSYCYVATCLQAEKQDLEMKNCNDQKLFSEYSINEQIARIHGYAISKTIETYSFDKKKFYLNLIKDIDHMLDHIYTEKYRDYFYIENNRVQKDKSYCNFIEFLKRNSIKLDNTVAVFLYLISVVIDELNFKLERIDYDDMKQYIDENNSEYKKHLSKIKNHLRSRNLETAIQAYNTFYKANVKNINEFHRKVLVLNETCWGYVIDKSKNLYNPYRYLQKSVKKYYNKLVGIQEID